MWMGGGVAPGYRVENRKLAIVPDEAAMVTHFKSMFSIRSMQIAMACRLHAGGNMRRSRKCPDWHDGTS